MSSPEEQKLLSELLSQKGNYLLPIEIEEACNYAAEIQKATNPTNFEKNWLVDFNLNIATAVMNSHKLDLKVKDRAHPENPNLDDTENLANPEGSNINQALALKKVEENQNESVLNKRDSDKIEDQYESIRQDRTPSQTSIKQIEHMATSSPKRGIGIDVRNQTKAKESENILDKDSNVWGSDFTPIGFDGPNNRDVSPPTQLGHKRLTVPKIKLNELVNKPSIFDGDRKKARRWLEDFEICSLNNGWDNRTMAFYFSAFLNSSCKDWYNNMALPLISSNIDWFALKSIFLRTFVGPDAEQSIKEEYQRTKQRKDETITEFIPRLLRLMRLMDPNQTEYSRVKDIKSKLTDDYRDKLIGKNPETILELNDICLEIEDRLIISKTNKYKESKNYADNKFTKQADNQKNKFIKKSNKNEKTNQKVQDQNIKCTRCDRQGHLKEKCFAKSKLDGTKLAEKKTTAISEDHQPNTSEQIKVTTLRNVCSVVAAVNSRTRLICPALVNDMDINMWIDTGSDHTLMSLEFANKLNLKVTPQTYNIHGANSLVLDCVGFVEIELKIKLGKILKKAEIKVIVVDKLCSEFILGMDYMIPFKIVVNTHNHRISFEGEKNGVRVLEPVTIPARSQTIISGSIIKNELPPTVVIKPFNFCTNLITANCISEVTEVGNVSCLILNLDNTETEIPADTQIASFETLEEIHTQDQKFCSATMKIAEHQETVNIGDDLTSLQQQDLAKLLVKYQEAFSINGSLGLTNLTEHEIELLPEARPVVEPLRRRPKIHKDETSKQIKSMLKEGIIEPSTSPWAAAYVIVKKKTGDSRLCIDFRKLNSVTKKCSYPLPNVEDCLEPITGNTFFSQLDLFSDFGK